MDKLELFRDANTKGTLTITQVQQIDKIQITVSNKNMIAQQIKATVNLILRELIPSEEDTHNDELQKFFAIGNMSQIETLNKMLDKIQKYLRVRAELISVLASIHSCSEMYGDILEMYSRFSEEFDAEIAVSLLKKVKIYQKAVGISLQQVDRVAQLYNKILERIKLNKFQFSVK